MIARASSPRTRWMSGRKYWKSRTRRFQRTFLKSGFVCRGIAAVSDLALEGRDHREHPGSIPVPGVLLDGEVPGGAGEACGEAGTCPQFLDVVDDLVGASGGGGGGPPAGGGGLPHLAGPPPPQPPPPPPALLD